jgi:hypothetical protein
VTFGDPVLGDQLNLQGFGSITDQTADTGTLSLFQLSVDDATALNSLQAGSFVLSTVSFNAIAPGISPLTLSVTTLGDATGAPLLASITPGSIVVVPEPATSALIAGGLLIAIAAQFRRRRTTVRFTQDAYRNVA